MRNPFGQIRRPGRRRSAESGNSAGATGEPAATGAAGSGGSGSDSWFRPAAGDGSAEPTPPTKVKRRKRRLVRAAWASIGAVIVLFLMAFVAYARIDVPPANASAIRQTTQVFFSDDKTLLGRYGDTNRIIVPLSDMPIHLRDAVLAAENRSFYTDSGVSPKGIARALWVNLKGGQTQGGSTITQQYVKNYYLTSERSIQRKLKEALLSIKIDKEKSKDQILEDYLNTIYLGRGAYGVQAAAKAYFNTEVRKLSISQGAVLAAIVRSPANYEPTSEAGLERLQGRWGYVLDSMVATGKLSQPARTAMKFPKFPAQAKDASRFGGQKGYLLGAISKELQARGLTKDPIENGGLRIITTLDAQAQKSAEEAVPAEFPKIKNKALRVGLAAVEPGTGRILAMYGGKDFLGKDKYAQVNAATSPIQPGSQMKVFAVAGALEHGDTLGSRYTSRSPLKLPGNASVRNEFNRSYGRTQDIMYGLQESINTVFVDLTLKHGPQVVRDAMVRAGIPDNAPGLINNALIPLGIASLTPLQVANSYATLCSGGTRADAHIVERVIGANGGEFSALTKIAKPQRDVFDPAVVSDVLRAMENVVARGTGTRAKALGRPVAGKTGTHQDLTAWFSGCTPQVAASVDYFKGDGTESLDGSGGMPTFFGGTFPAQTWTTFMKGAMEGKPVEDFDLAPGVTPTATPRPTDPAAPPPATGPTTEPSGFPFPSFPPFPEPSKTPAPRATSTTTKPPTTAPSSTPTATSGGSEDPETDQSQEDPFESGGAPPATDPA